MGRQAVDERPAPSAEELVARHRDGDRGALRELMVRYGPSMTAVARRYLGDAHDVEDAVQDAWMAFLRSGHTIAHTERVAAWLCVTAERAALSIARRRSRCVPVPESTIVRRDWCVDEHGEVDRAREQRAVRDAVGRLNERDRTLIELLVSGDDLSYTTIGTLTGCAVGSIGPTRQRILARLGRDASIRRLAVQMA
jgi:RNA polymerase sigma factor (sigma-70 family)